MSAAERWKPVPIPGFSSLYDVSDHGRVRRAGLTLKTVAIQKDVQGYLCVSLNRPGRGRSSFRVARLVATCFVPGGGPSLNVTYRDQDSGNCAASNLLWRTSAAINKRSRESGRWKPLLHCRNHVKLTESNVRQIRELASEDKSSRALARIGRQFGVARETVYAVVTGVTWKHVPQSGSRRSCAT